MNLQFIISNHDQQYLVYIIGVNNTLNEVLSADNVFSTHSQFAITAAEFDNLKLNIIDTINSWEIRHHSKQIVLPGQWHTFKQVVLLNQIDTKSFNLNYLPKIETDLRRDINNDHTFFINNLKDFNTLVLGYKCNYIINIDMDIQDITAFVSKIDNLLAIGGVFYDYKPSEALKQHMETTPNYNKYKLNSTSLYSLELEDI